MAAGITGPAIVSITTQICGDAVPLLSAENLNQELIWWNLNWIVYTVRQAGWIREDWDAFHEWKTQPVED